MPKRDSAVSRRLRATPSARTLILALALTGLASGGADADRLPQHLERLAAQLHHGSADAMRIAAGAAEGARLKVHQQAAEAIRRAGLSPGARSSLGVGAMFDQAARALRLNPTSPATLNAIQLLFDLQGEELTEAVAAMLGEKADSPAVETALAELLRLRSGGGLATGHVMDLDGGERLEVDWNPETAAVALRAARIDGADAYDFTLSGHAVLERDPASGEIELAARPDPQQPPLALTAAEVEDRILSVLGIWENDDYVMTVIGASDAAGAVARSPELAQREIETLRQRAEELRRAVEHVWEDPRTGEIVRQERLRPLDAPWVYRGERSLVPNAEAQIAALDAQIAALEGEIDGTARPPAERLDPVAYERVRSRPGARPLRIEMEAKANGCRHDFDQAAFDGRHLVARRTHTAVCSTSAELPMQVRTALVASWAPPEWLLLSAEYGADAALRLDGAFWGMHVSYEPIALRIDRILDPYLSQPLRFEEGGGQNFLAFGAAATQLP